MIFNDIKINGSIVLFNNDKNDIDKVVTSFFSCKLSKKLYVIDNSPDDDARLWFAGINNIEYIKSKNIGYGAAHNIALKKSIADSDYHVVLNPDIYFDENVLNHLSTYLNDNEDVGSIMPLIVYPNDEIQYLCKLLPTPFDLIFRRFLPQKLTYRRNERYELRFTNYNRIMDVPYLSGCFMFLRSKVLKDIGFFDERFFMYPEDVDLTRRINEKYRTIFYPYVKVVHNHAKQSYKSKKMLLIHILNMIKYFNKWGWFFDSKRINQNLKTIRLLEEQELL